MQNESSPDDAQRLKRLVQEAGLTSFRTEGCRRALMFRGRTREWVVVARLRGGWLNVYTWVCDLPAESGLRARLLDVALATNAEMPLAKFVSAGALILELDYRADHVDADVVHALVELLHAQAEEYYPRIFRTVSGDDVLEALAGRSVAQTRDGS